MKTENYIIVASDHGATLSKIVNELDDLENYNCITISSVVLLIKLLETVSPKLIIVHFRNNTLQLNHLFKLQSNVKLPILCLINRYEKLKINYEEKPLIIQSIDTLEHKYLSTNVKSILSIVTKQVVLEDQYFKEKNGPKLLTENKNLARYVLELDQKKILLQKIMERIKELSSITDLPMRNRLNSIVNSIKLNTKTSHWEDFKLYFENINPNFIKQLTAKYPCLTSKDIKYCCYLKMNMSNEDIRYILGINKESVRTHKYRLKKKMTLEKKQDLRMFISSF
ncbi:helix-turn-helix transcriptional regulator [Tenacibaculum agarivorans]|uniref:helix-turn-helix transcriptional regulator n=1 Tax=Tenacibaculum agarivorans TaxID=1908389 RepID=UPI00094BB46D|nr:LuxR C-terminal-related transcriptional regulator [Tenacibaculum agarivorans]